MINTLMSGHYRVMTIGALAAVLSPTMASAKVPGKTYCFNGVCHTVKSLGETQSMVGRKQWANTSFYDDAKRDRFNPSNITSSGEYFRSWAADNAASPTLPNGTRVVVWNPTTKKSVLVRINNSGPYYGNRTLDLSRGAAEKLGMIKSGTKRLQYIVVGAPSQTEAKYSRGRTYAPVRGYMGAFASAEEAVASAGGSAVTQRATASRTVTSKAVATRADASKTVASKTVASSGTARRVVTSTVTTEYVVTKKRPATQLDQTPRRVIDTAPSYIQYR